MDPEELFLPEERHAEVRRQILALQLDEPGAEYPFSAKLAKGRSWKKDFTLRVVDEYLKYLVLRAFYGPHMVPSTIVDHAWHLHLQYTVSYWETFCRDIVGRAMHHFPGNGSKSDLEISAALFQKTRSKYIEHFGQPPVDIWGPGDPAIDWRKILSKLPAPKRVHSTVIKLFPRPSDEAE